MPGYFLTGATGFVGGALALKLLESTDDPVTCLVRDAGGNPDARLEAALRAAAAAYGYPAGFIDASRPRIRAVPGTLGQAAELAGPAGLRAREFWHCAASLRFDDRARGEIFAANVDGTGQALRLARRLGAGVFNHMSTAYVAGRRTGPIDEGPVPPGTAANNLYEQSKMDGERLVAAAAGIQARIWRPSIVVGHSRTLAATSFSGLYRMMREIARFAAAGPGTPGGSRSPRIVAVPGGTVNFVPVDYVVDQAVALSLAGIEDEVVHLTNEVSPTVERCFALFFAELGLSRPAFVATREQLSASDAILNRRLAFYWSYLSGARQFRQQAAARHGRVLRFEFDDDTLLSYFRWYLAHLATARGPATAA